MHSLGATFYRCFLVGFLEDREVYRRTAKPIIIIHVAIVAKSRLFNQSSPCVIVLP